MAWVGNLFFFPLLSFLFFKFFLFWFFLFGRERQSRPSPRPPSQGSQGPPTTQITPSHQDSAVNIPRCWSPCCWTSYISLPSKRPSSFYRKKNRWLSSISNSCWRNELSLSWFQNGADVDINTKNSRNSSGSNETIQNSLQYTSWKDR